MNTSSIYKSENGQKEIMALYDRVLANWPVPCQTCTLPTRHGDTFVIASGESAFPPLVLLHGSSSNAVSWIGEAGAYSRHFRVYAVDLPGEPGRSAQTRPSWHNLDFTEWLEDVLNGLQIQTVMLLGLSQGGWTALRFATIHPERVQKLVLLAPGGVAPTRPSFIARAIGLSLMGPWGAERINRIVFGRQPIHPEALKFMNAIMTHFKPRIEKEYIFSDVELKCLEMPTLFIGGEKDALCHTPKIAARLQTLVPRLTTILLPDTGHALINLPDQVMPFLLEK
jgi:pimeloyl-ACP methyl ester carboxylesterase